MMESSRWWSTWGLFTALSVVACSPSPAAGGAAPRSLSPTGQVSTDGAGDPIPLVDLPDPSDRPAALGFEGASAWLNIDHPLTLEELRGRVVVVDFWTSCCINCLHTLPTLARVEERFAGQPVVVVGVHSPKFDEERDPARLVDQLAQLSVAHPVAVDGDMAIWKRWGAKSWPTVLVLDVEGRPVWGRGGEPDYDELSSVVASALHEGRERGALAKLPLSGLRVESTSSGPLRYPGKVLALADGGLAVADTGHHRVVLLDREGRLDAIVGNGQAGLADGAFSTASFRWPQGMAELDGDLFVADTNNHTIRRIDREARTVTTVAGTGALGEGALGDRPARATELALRSPWDLLPVGGELVVALAGSHQIGVLSVARGEVRRLAGNGEEDIVDGSLESSSFAQPSGLATDGREIFVLDSETSSVRAIDVAAGKVRTIVGKGLFVFGDTDGDRETTRLQHPIGLAYGAGALWVADTYNSKLKKIDPKTGVTTTVLGGAGGGLSEPAGVTFARGRLFVADTNRHRVLEVPVETAGPLAPVVVPLTDVRAPRTTTERRVVIDPQDPVAPLGTLELSPDRPSRVFVGFSAPAGTKVNAEGPARVTWIDAAGLARTPATIRTQGAEVQKGFDLMLEPAPEASGGHLRGVLELVICDAESARVCLPVRRTLEARIVVREGGVPRAEPVRLPKAE